MYKLYNTQSDFTTNIVQMIKSFFPDIRKTQLNIIPSIIFGLIDSNLLLLQILSNLLKMNSLLISSLLILKESLDFSITIILMAISFSIKPSIMSLINLFQNILICVSILYLITCISPIDLLYLCFLCASVNRASLFGLDDGLKKENSRDAFQRNVIIDGINYVSNLFKDKNVNLIFLADRWFGTHTYLLKHIASLGHTYVIRVKSDTKVFFQKKYEKNKSWMTLSKLPSLVYHSKSFDDIELFNERYIANLVISSSIDHKEPWYLITNGNPRRAVKDYAYRFGAIECMFKSQKSNGFYLESTMTRNLWAFKNLYSLVCFSVLWLTILGTYFEKNKYGVFADLGIKTSYQTAGGTRKRYLSLFNTGLTLFRLALNSLRFIRLSFNLKLYDI